MSFSERKGLKVRDTLQVGTVDDELRASLWNLLHMHIWDREGFLWDGYGGRGRVVEFAQSLWFLYVKRPFSDLPPHPANILTLIQQYFFRLAWNEVYDFLELVVTIENDPELEKDINRVLERELAGYRLINGQFIDVTDPQEVSALKEALRRDQFAPVATHLARALELLADRKNPDYRNSIKESISAVESVVRILTKKNNAQLGDALRLLENTTGLHPALREAFSRMYGYTSDSDPQGSLQNRP